MNIIQELSETPLQIDEVPRHIVWLRHHIITNHLEVEHLLYAELARSHENLQLVNNIVGLLWLLGMEYDRLEMSSYRELKEVFFDDSLPIQFRVNAARVAATDYNRYSSQERSEILAILEQIYEELKTFKIERDAGLQYLISVVMNCCEARRTGFGDFCATLSFDRTFQTVNVPEYVESKLRDGSLAKFGFGPEHSEYVELKISQSLLTGHLYMAQKDWWRHRVKTVAIFTWTPKGEELKLRLNWKCNFKENKAILLSGTN